MKGSLGLTLVTGKPLHPPLPLLTRHRCSVTLGRSERERSWHGVDGASEGLLRLGLRTTEILVFLLRSKAGPGILDSAPLWPPSSC